MPAGHCCPCGQVLDGWRRVLAAQSLGQEAISARVAWAASDIERFVEAVARNSRNSLALTAADRHSAVVTLLSMDPATSDREVARACGVCQGTVSAARGTLTRSGGSMGHLNRRGADGKVYTRPISACTAACLKRAMETILRLEVAPSRRDMARTLGCSIGTLNPVHRRVSARLSAEGRLGRFLRRVIARVMYPRRLGTLAAAREQDAVR